MCVGRAGVRRVLQWTSVPHAARAPRAEPEVQGSACVRGGSFSVACAPRARLSAGGGRNMPVRRALIVGAGVGGLAAAQCLKRVGIDSVVVEASKAFERSPRGLGIWPSGQQVLRQLGLQERLAQMSKFNPPASYRDGKGVWLSSPTPQTAASVRVMTLERDDLVEVCPFACSLSSVWDKAALAADTDIRWNDTLVALGKGDGQGSVLCQLQSNDRIEVDLVVGADGLHSSVSSFLRQYGGEQMHDHIHLKEMTGITNSGGKIVEWCVSGYVEWRNAGGLLDYPFETLAHGSRFAVVPLRKKELQDQALDRAFWFATVKDCEMLRATLTEEGMEKTKCDVSVESGKKIGDAILRKFSDQDNWHSPIPAIAKMALESGGNYVERRLSSSQVPCVARQSHVPGTYSEILGLIGDAAHPMPHNLAQGATLALEEAWLLALALHEENRLAGHACGPRSNPWLRLDEQRARRIRNCSIVSAFTHNLAHPPFAATLLAWLRDKLLAMVPQPLNGMVFDAFLKFSLGGSQYCIPGLRAPTSSSVVQNDIQHSST
eukprot:scaffold1233_cov395-Prasinococcus_capsulatus_cf.AAC.29